MIAPRTAKQRRERGGGRKEGAARKGCPRGGVFTQDLTLTEMSLPFKDEQSPDGQHLAALCRPRRRTKRVLVSQASPGLGCQAWRLERKKRRLFKLRLSLAWGPRPSSCAHG